jgi:L-alanine-DL-glutamate epimerase-like enolase superfamily enzyme
VTCQYLAHDIVDAPIRVERGHVRLPERPGLGITVDESRLMRFAQKLAA